MGSITQPKMIGKQKGLSLPQKCFTHESTDKETLHQILFETKVKLWETIKNFENRKDMEFAYPSIIVAFQLASLPITLVWNTIMLFPTVIAFSEFSPDTSTFKETSSPTET